MRMTSMKERTMRKRTSSQFEDYEFALLVALGGLKCFFCSVFFGYVDIAVTKMILWHFSYVLTTKYRFAMMS